MLSQKVFGVLIKGEIIPTNSTNNQYKQVVNYLSDEENLKAMQQTFKAFGYILNFEADVIYLSKEEIDESEIKRFNTLFKDTIIATAILKLIYPSIRLNSTIKYTDIIVQMQSNQKVGEIIELYFKKQDFKSTIDTIFSILKKNNIIEQINYNDNDSFRVLSTINYFLSIIDAMEI